MSVHSKITASVKGPTPANLLFLHFSSVHRRPFPPSSRPLLGSRGRGISQEWRRQTLQTRHVGEGRRKPSSKWLANWLGWNYLVIINCTRLGFDVPAMHATKRLKAADEAFLFFSFFFFIARERAASLCKRALNERLVF